MPRLLAARFESVGHRDARLDGLTLPLLGHDGHPADSVLWLRNGGGKSSILNLLFSVLRPNQREFLGSEADAGVRELRHYLAPDDTGTVCLAWELDAEGDGPLPQLLTGVTMEYGSGGGGEGRDLRRLFFAMRIDEPKVDRRPIDELPLTAHEGGKRRVLRLSAVREALLELGQSAGVEVSVTETQRKWRGLLESYGLDPEVFGYQIKMNRSEGIADEIFRFGSPEEFSDFVLEMVLPTDQADQVSANLRELRARVAERPRLVRERDALIEAAKALGPVVGLAGERNEAQDKLGEALGELLNTAVQVDAARSQRARLIREADVELARQEARYRPTSQERIGAQWAHNVLKDLRQQRICDQREVEAATSRDDVKRLEREAALLRVAEDLAESREGRDEAHLLRDELQARLSEARPLLSELQASACQLRRALGSEIDILDSRAELLEQRQDETSIKLEGAVKQVRDEAVVIGRADERVESLRERLERLSRARDELERQGELAPGEPVIEAVERTSRQVDSAESRRQAAEARAQEAEPVAQAAREAAGEARERAADARREADLTRRALDEAGRQISRISSSPALQRALEDSDPDLLTLGNDALARLGSRLSTLSDEILSLRLAEEQDHRGLEWLERHGLLPPSIDAEAVQRLLAERGLRAFTGGAYLAENRRGKGADARVRARPELAAGVVVDEADLERAAAMLEADPPEVSSPVVVGTAKDLLEGGENRLVVMPPSALFSRTAARDEQERRRAAASSRQGKLGTLTTEKIELEDVRGELRGLLDRHPARWFEETRARLDGHVTDADAATAEADGHTRREAEALDAMVAARAEARERDLDGRRLERTLTRLDSFAREGGDEVPALESEVARLCKDQDRARRAQQEAQVEASKLRKILNDLARQSRQLAAEREPLQRERAGVRADCADDEGDGGDQPLELGPARQLYDSRKRAYQERTGAESLQGRIEAIEARVEAVERKLETKLVQISAHRQEVEAAYDRAIATLGLSETQSRMAQSLDRARIGSSKAQSRLVLAKAMASQTEAEVARLIDQHRAKVVEGWQQKAEDWDLDRLSQEMTDSHERSTAAREEELDAQTRRDAAKAAGDQARLDLQRLTDWATRISDARIHLPDLPVVRRALAADIPGELFNRGHDEPSEEADRTPLLEDLERRTDLEVQAVNASTNRVRDVEGRALKAARELESFAVDPEREVLPHSIRQRLREIDLDLLLPRAASLLDDIKIRGDNIASELAEVEQHRKLISIGLERATDRALEVLRELEPASVFPPDVASWGGHAFIKVRLKVPPTAPERSAVAATLIDRLVQQHDVPSGLKLIQLMVRELTRGGGLTVRILKPEVHRRLDYSPVQGLRAFSGGERLTSAILLYCTLARMRAQRRGASKAPTSVLVLDNPVGACSHPEFLDLQRDMARSHRVQLLYTTGVEDLEALARLPNILRLRNSHADLRGRRRVTFEEASPLTVARVSRAEE
jgi:hypothetical protein